MYGKLFMSIYDGTLVEDWRALITFQQMIILCDSDGILDMTPHALQKRTGIPIEHIKAGIEILENKDPYSRTPKEEGRRITRLSHERPWGWVIVNHKHYRDLRTANERREYMREYMREKRAKDKLTKTNANLQKIHVSKLANTDEDTDTNADTPKREARSKKFIPPSLQEIKDFIALKNYNVDAEKFYYHYDTNGWMVGRTKMKKWKSAIAKWNTSEKGNNYDRPSKPLTAVERVELANGGSHPPILDITPRTNGVE